MELLLAPSHMRDSHVISYGRIYLGTRFRRGWKGFLYLHQYKHVYLYISLYLRIETEKVTMLIEKVLLISLLLGELVRSGHARSYANRAN